APRSVARPRPAPRTSPAPRLAPRTSAAHRVAPTWFASPRFAPRKSAPSRFALSPWLRMIPTRSIGPATNTLRALRFPVESHGPALSGSTPTHRQWVGLAPPDCAAEIVFATCRPPGTHVSGLSGPSDVTHSFPG